MANIAIFKPNSTPEYLVSVNGAEYLANPTSNDLTPNSPDILINPDISAVKGVPTKFWKRVGNSIVEMSQLEKDTVTAAELQARKNFADDFGIEDMKIVLTALIKVINTKLGATKQITKQEVIDALKGEIV